MVKEFTTFISSHQTSYLLGISIPLFAFGIWGESTCTFLWVITITSSNINFVRTQSNVTVWDDPHDSAVNCIASDNNMTILTGTATHGGIRLWDKRSTRCVQLYFVQPDLRSPVYSLDFDSLEMYAALDTSVLGFDFSGGKRKPTKDLVVYPCNWCSIIRPFLFYSWDCYIVIR